MMRGGGALAPRLIRWELQGPDALLQGVQSRLAELEPGFGGRVSFRFAGSEGLLLGLRAQIGPGGRWLAGQGPLAEAVARQLSPWVQHRTPGGEAGLEVALAYGDEQNPLLPAHLAEGAALGLADTLREPFSFPCSDRSYEERDLTRLSGVPASALALLLEATGLAGLAEAFCQAEAEAGVNGLALAALAAWQSAWGTSRIARERGNPLAWGAGPGGPRFASMAKSIAAVAPQIRRHYLEPGGRCFYGPNLIGMNVAYATDPLWRHGVGAIWRRLAERLRGR